MSALPWPRVARAGARALGAGAAGGAALGVGLLLPASPRLGLAAAAAVLLLGALAVRPAAVALAAMPLLLVSIRLGVGGGVSVSDLALAGAAAVALVFAPRPFSAPLRALLWLCVGYQLATAFTVVAHPYSANAVEWLHAGLLVGGALLVGWMLGREGLAPAGLTLLLGACLGLAAATVAQGAWQLARGDTGPVYLAWPWGMHKNFVGTVLGFAAVLAYAAPGWVGWPRRRALAAFWVLVAGLGFTQSRQALVGLAVALAVVVLRRGGVGSRGMLAVVAGALAAVGLAVAGQARAGDPFNSLYQRLRWAREAVEFGAESPWVGHGLRFWTVGRGLGYQPPNAELEVFAAAGLVGLVGFVALLAGSLLVLWRVEVEFGGLAVAVLLSRVVQAQLDLFWTAVQVSVPFLVVGMCLGAAAAAEEGVVAVARVEGVAGARLGGARTEAGAASSEGAGR